MAKETKEPYATSDTTEAAYLLYHGHKFVGLVPDKHDRKRMVFAFIKQENTDVLAEEYWSGDPQVNPRRFHRNIKDAIAIVVRDKERRNNG
jgi:hypothetical protein